MDREFDRSKWIATTSLPPTCSHSFSFMGGVGQKLVTQTLDVRNISAGSHTESIGGVDSSYRIGLSYKTGTDAHWFYILLYTFLTVGDEKTK